ncbi:MAG TPA: VPLPA-CTERM sorting domain-containing protein, partial [Gammaproteobacteria bacterium]|nr:VPLPA-CTERM sorting domain-containing protein [Gammaproteobacteria bacterium]
LEGTVGAVPVPAAAWLFGSGVVGLAGVARRRRNKKG